MYENILDQMIECIWSDNFIVPYHATVELEKDLLSIEDLTNCVLEGVIVERQKDRHSGEYKYIIEGVALDDRPMEVVAKLSLIRETYVITLYRVY
jgi:hypothetical protein